MARCLSIGVLSGANLLMKTKETLVVNDEQATIVRTIFNWYINGLNNVIQIQ
jgi:hypothetical protein